MPHKHTRKRNPNAANDYNLAPSTLAKPLPAFSGHTKDAKKIQLKRGARKPTQPAPNASLKRKRTGTVTKDYKEDDTPRAFARLMQFQATGKRPSGLDDDRESHKAAQKRKLAATTSASAATSTAKPEPIAAPKPAPAVEAPKILPGERLSDYNARVDRLYPVSGLARKGQVKVDGVKERVTKTEKRLKKMYASWREEDARRKEKLEEAAEVEEEEEEEKRMKYGKNYHGVTGKRRRAVGEVADDGGDDDPWAVLHERREKRGGLHDVVQAPPTMKVVPKEKFKVRENAKVEVANVPAAAGSLKRREELGDARRKVIERYREMMKGRSGL
ncbi:hypothetical protein LTR53_014481 [Teratosphaeriaceae sp. CCFEE 6253]|nr:hypothetical protein LTR53_014481 [Teratosphaeriaceae sp. CCFEE 6253]